MTENNNKILHLGIGAGAILGGGIAAKKIYDGISWGMDAKRGHEKIIEDLAHPDDVEEAKNRKLEILKNIAKSSYNKEIFKNVPDFAANYHRDQARLSRSAYEEGLMRSGIKLRKDASLVGSAIRKLSGGKYNWEF